MTTPTFALRVAQSRQRVEDVLARTYKRGKDGRFSSGGGSGGAVRDALSGHDTAEAVGAAAASEAKRITGRDIQFSLAGSDPALAAEHAEGILQGLERYPKAQLTRVYTYGTPGSAVPKERGLGEYGATYEHGGRTEVGFNLAEMRDPAKYRGLLQMGAATGEAVPRTPTGVALHEFGHVVSTGVNSEHSGAAIAARAAKAAGEPASDHVSRAISRYASASAGELSGEAFADVMVNGSKSSPLSRKIVDDMDAAYDHWVGMGMADHVRQVLSRTYKRDQQGRFGSGSGGVRQSLQDAQTTEAVAGVLKAEVSSILGRPVRVDFVGLDADVARVHAEGILRAAEAYPEARLRVVSTYGSESALGHTSGIDPTHYAVTLRGEDILFSTSYGHMDDLAGEMGHTDACGHLAGAKGDLTRIAVHEFGHVVDGTTDGRMGKAALRIAKELAGPTDRKAFTRTSVSRYAAQNAGELAAEAFMDVVSQGSGASLLSQRIFTEARGLAGDLYDLATPTFLLRLAHARERAGIAARTYTRDGDGKFSSGSGGSPDAMHEEAQIRAAYTFTDAATGHRTEVEGVFRPGDPNPDLNEVGRHPTVPPGRTMVTIRVLDASGKQIGQACRTVHPPSQARVNHNYLVLDEGERGQGFATRFNAHAEDVYRANGIRMVTLHANIDVGGYAWARAGYDFRNNQTRSATTAHAYVESVTRGHPQAAVDRFRELSNGGKATPLEIAMVGHTPGASTWPGKEVMLDSDWQGVKLL